MKFIGYQIQYLLCMNKLSWGYHLQNVPISIHTKCIKSFGWQNTTKIIWTVRKWQWLIVQKLFQFLPTQNSSKEGKKRSLSRRLVIYSSEWIIIEEIMFVLSKESMTYILMTLAREVMIPSFKKIPSQKSTVGNFESMNNVILTLMNLQ